MNRTLSLMMLACIQTSLLAAKPTDITFVNPDQWTTTVTVEKSPAVVVIIQPQDKATIRNVADETIAISATGTSNGKMITVSRRFTGYNNGKKTWTIHPQAYDRTINITKS